MFVSQLNKSNAKAPKAYNQILKYMLSNDVFCITAHVDEWVNHIGLSKKHLSIDYRKHYQQRGQEGPGREKGLLLKRIASQKIVKATHLLENLE